MSLCTRDEFNAHGERWARPQSTPDVSELAVRPMKSLRKYLEQAPMHGATTDAITDALREAILDGALPPSTWLREDELAKELNVSRTPIREALRRLSDEHLTVRSVHRGTIVAPMGLDDVLAVYAVREVLEGLAARMTALHQPAGAIDALLRIHAQMIAAEHSDKESLPRLNLDFHAVLRESSGNAYLQRFLTQVEHAVRRFGSSTLDQADRRAAVLGEHKAIIDAIIDGDGDLASRRAIEHMRRAREIRVQQITTV